MTLPREFETTLCELLEAAKKNAYKHIVREFDQKANILRKLLIEELGKPREVEKSKTVVNQKNETDQNEIEIIYLRNAALVDKVNSKESITNPNDAKQSLDQQSDDGPSPNAKPASSYSPESYPNPVDSQIKDACLESTDCGCFDCFLHSVEVTMVLPNDANDDDAQMELSPNKKRRLSSKRQKSTNSTENVPSPQIEPNQSEKKQPDDNLPSVSGQSMAPAHKPGKPTFHLLSLFCSVDNCEAELPNRDQLEVHLAVVHGTPRYTCQLDDCTLTFNTQSDFIKHRRQHGPLNQWLCPFCATPYLAPTHASFASHLCNVHQIGRFQCSACPFIAHDRPSAQWHYKVTHGSVTCQVCGRTLSSEDNLRRHRQTHLPVAARSYHCTWPDCEYTSGRSYCAKKHIRTAHLGLPGTLREQRERAIVDDRDPMQWLAIVHTEEADN